MDRHTAVSIREDMFYINGEPTYQGRTWNGYKIEGLLMNARLVQGIFDDLNPITRGRWVYPDTGAWDAARNTREFIAAMPGWRAMDCWRSPSTCKGAAPMDTRRSTRATPT